MPTNISMFRPDDPYEMLISQMIAVERQPQIRLKEERTNQSRLKGVMDDLNTRVSALHKLLKGLTDVVASPFRARSANVDTSAFAVSAGDTAALGNHTLQIQRLATSDARISKQFTSSGTDLRTYFDTNGAQTFEIGVAKPTAADPDNRVLVSVTVDPAGTTDGEIMAEINTAINTAMSDAVTAGTLTKADVASASVVNETSTTTRLSLRSGTTGYANRLTFTDSGNGLLALLETTNNAVASGTSGGQVTAVGTSETDSALNSQFVLDGLTLYRSTNRVTDALSDVTLDLKQAGGNAVEFSITSDSSAVKASANDFIKKYNDLLTYIANKSTVDGTTGTRGDFAGDTTFSGLRSNMRNDVARYVSGQPADGPQMLTDLGIIINKDGTLELKDADKLIAAVEKDAGAVESLFSGEDGVATRLTSRVDAFVGTNGIVSQRKKSIDDRLTRLNSRIGDYDKRLGQRETQLRMQFARLQESLAMLQGQQNNINMFFYQ